MPDAPERQEPFNQAFMPDLINGYPFKIAPAGSPPSLVLADQVKSQDCRAQGDAQGPVSAAKLAEVWARAKTVRSESLELPLRG